MALAKGSRKVKAPKASDLQTTFRALNPSLDPSPARQAQYEVATYRAARKKDSPMRQRGKKGPVPGGR